MLACLFAEVFLLITFFLFLAIVEGFPLLSASFFPFPLELATTFSLGPLEVKVVTLSFGLVVVSTSLVIVAPPVGGLLD